MKLNKKTIAIVLSVLLILVIYGLFSDGTTGPELAEVRRGEVIREIFETGIMKRGEEISLGFKISGRIETNYTSVGQRVEKGEPLSKLEDSDLMFQLSRAENNLASAKSTLDKLMTGATLQERQIAQISAQNAEEAFLTAQQNLEDVKNLADQRMQNIRQSALVSLNNALVGTESALGLADTIMQAYFIGFHTEETLKGRNARDGIAEAVGEIREGRNLITQSDNIEGILIKAEGSLASVFNNLDIIIQVCESNLYRGQVSSEHLLALRSEKSTINQVLTGVSENRQSTSLVKITNDIEISSAQSQFLTAKTQLDKAKSELEILTGSPREEDIRFYESQMRLAEAEVNLLRNQLQSATLTAPTDGQVVDVQKRSGELVQPAEPVLRFISDSAVHLEVNIYEGNVGEIQIGNQAEIEIVAFPGVTLEGEVISIDPASRVVDGVVYYRTIIGLKEAFAGIMPGMSADVVIIADKKEDVLVIPESALIRNRPVPTVNVLVNGVPEERKIEIGLRGSDRMIEVLAGLEEGEIVTLR